MKTFGHIEREETYELAKLLSVDIPGDFNLLPGNTYGGNVLPRFAILTEGGDVAQRITETGADYSFYRLDYLEGDNQRVVAGRYIALIMAGRRTELAYRSEQAPAKRLTVHAGEGLLVVGRPDERAVPFTLDADVIKEVTLPPARFYTFEVPVWTRKSDLIVSGLYKGETDRGDLEQYVQPGQATVEAPEGRVNVPIDFATRYKLGGQDRPPGLYGAAP
jgi:hypothetical protein